MRRTVAVISFLALAALASLVGATQSNGASLGAKQGSAAKTHLTALATPTTKVHLLTPAKSARRESAWGCSYGSPLYGPTTYCVYVSGGGTWVNSVTGNWSGSAEITNWYITAEFFNTSWNWYQTYYSGMHYGWATAGGAVIYINAYKQRGYVCSTLHYWNGWSNRAMSRCFSIG